MREDAQRGQSVMCDCELLTLLERAGLFCLGH